MDHDRGVIMRRAPAEQPLPELGDPVAKRQKKLARMMVRGEAINAELIAFAAAARARIAAIKIAEVED